MTLPILLLGLGLAFVIAEVLFPSFGALSILATVSIVAAVVLAFRESSTAGVWFLAVTAFLLPAVVLLGFKLFPKSPIGRLFVVQGPSFVTRAATDQRDTELVGAEGLVEAPCRPAGIARIRGRRVDVVTRGEVIEKGTAVVVLEVEGNRVVIAAVGPSAAPAHSHETSA